MRKDLSARRGVSRRGFLTVAVSAIVAGVVAGVGAYYAGTLAAPVKEVVKEITKTLERPITITETRTETRTVTTTERITTTVVPGVTPTPQTVTTTVTTTITQPPITQTVTKTVTVTPPTLADIREELVQAAKKEGKVVLYTSMPVAICDALEKKFEQLYGIDLEWWRSDTDSVLNRFITEFDGGKYIMDIIRVPLPFAEGSVLLRKTELLSKYVESIPAPYKDPEGYWLSDALIPFSMCYNTKLLKPEELPKKPPELADSKWRGKIAWSDLSTQSYAVVWMNTFEKRYGIDVVKGWAANKPILSGLFTVPIAKVATGEAPITLPVPIPLIMDPKSKGSPVDMVRSPDNAYPAEPSCWMVSSKAPHPNAAELFISFVLAVDGGQEVLLNVGGYQPVWPGVKVMKPELYLKDMKVEYFPEPLWGDALKKKQEEYMKIFGYH